LKTVYFDNAATTKLDSRVLNRMLPYLSDEFGNPSSLHSFGQKPLSAISEARDEVASLIGCDATEIAFTSCGSESASLAIKGLAFRNLEKKGRIITSEIEHLSILHPLKSLGRLGFEIVKIPVDEAGVFDPQAVGEAINGDTILVTLTHASNEIGTLEPVAEVGAITKEAGIPFHLDAVQTAGTIPVDVGDIGCDMLTLAASQFHGPKGAAALYRRKGIRLAPLIEGGVQEGGLRAGTENVAGIVGLGEAARLARLEMESRIAKVEPMRDALIDGILDTIPDTRLNGHRGRRLPGNVNVSILYIEGESMLLLLDGQGIGASSGSACTSRALKASHVLLAIGLAAEVAHGSLLLTLSKDNEMSDVDYFLGLFPGIVERLRSMSPLYGDSSG
jgi:cysteine desulfurase